MIIMRPRGRYKILPGIFLVYARVAERPIKMTRERCEAIWRNFHQQMTHFPATNDWNFDWDLKCEPFYKLKMKY